MKIYINKYRHHWLSPYTILKFVCFWEKDEDVFYNHEDVPGHKYDKWVNRLNPICGALQKFLDIVHPKIDYVRIDPWDTWSMDSTLSQIILPMLRQLQATKHGAPFVDDKDVPAGQGLRSTEAPPKENEWDTDDNHFKRWDWVLDELIWTFEQLQPDADWQDKYWTGNHEYKSEACDWDETGKATMYQMKEGPNHTAKWDKKGHMAHQRRIQNGLKLFGKYYQALWD